MAEEDSFISYLEGCTAPAYDKNQVYHACRPGAVHQQVISMLVMLLTLGSLVLCLGLGHIQKCFGHWLE